MTVTLPQGAGGAGPRSPIGVPVAATTVNSTNPNNFPVYVAASNSATAISNVKVGGVTVGSAAGTYLVPANGTINCSFASGALSYVTSPTGLTPATSYPFTDPVYQQFTCQQLLQVAGVNPATTDA